MSKANDRLMNQLMSYLMANMQSVNDARKQESPYITRIGGDANKFLDEIGKKNYSQGFTPGTFWTMDSLADRTQHRDKLLNAAPTGDAALANRGDTSKTFLELDKQNRKDEFAANYGREFQDAVGQQTQNAKNATYQIGQLDQNRRMGVAGDITGLLGTAFQAQNTKPAPYWQTLVMGGLQSLPGIIQGIRGGGEDGGGIDERQPSMTGAFSTQNPYGQWYQQPQSPPSSIRTYSNNYGGGGYV